MALKQIAAPAVEPVTLTEAKTHIKVELEDTAEDDLITRLIKAAREYCENFQNRVYISQTWDLVLDAWPYKNYVEIPLPKLQSITSVKYYDQSGTESTLADSEYIVDTDSYVGRISLAYNCSWPSAILQPINSIRIRFVAGYGDDAASVPERVKQAMLLLIGYWFDNREAALTGSVSKEIEFAVHALLAQDRVVPV